MATRGIIANIQGEAVSYITVQKGAEIDRMLSLLKKFRAKEKQVAGMIKEGNLICMKVTDMLIGERFISELNLDDKAPTLTLTNMPFFTVMDRAKSEEVDSVFIFRDDTWEAYDVAEYSSGKTVKYS